MWLNLDATSDNSQRARIAAIYLDMRSNGILVVNLTVTNIPLISQARYIEFSGKQADFNM